MINKVVVFIEDEKIILSPNEGVMINSNVLHQIKPYTTNNCMMFSIDFNSTLIGGAELSLIEKKYLTPIIKNRNLKFISLKPNIPWQKNILKHLKKVFTLSHEKPYGYELEMRNYLSIAWLNLIKEMKDEINTSPLTMSNDDERVKLAMQYIHKYYTHNILLDNIAMAAHISKSECCRCFKRLLNVTPFEYLIEYRISKASELLVKSEAPISNIALDVGFNGISYFGKTFKRHTNYTPSEYRNKYSEFKLI